MSDFQAAPSPGFNFRAMLPTLIFDIALPIIVFNVLSHHGVSVLWSLIASGATPVLNNLRVWIAQRRLDALGIIIVTFIAVGTVASLISGNVFFALIKDSFLTGTFGLICLGSLLAPRPLMFAIMRQFVAGDDPARIAWWNGLWQLDGFRKDVRFVTFVWGVAYVIEALVRVGLALALTPAMVVTVSPVLSFGILVLLILWSPRYMIAGRDRRLREQASSSSP